MTTNSPIAEFTDRTHCIACESPSLITLSSGRFNKGPVSKFLEQDPWGTSPLPFLADQEWRYVECASCQQRFQQRLLTPHWQEIRFREWMTGDAIRAFAKANGTSSPAVRFDKASRLVKHVLRLEKMTRSIRGNAAVRVVDFGCGWGEFLTLARTFGFESFGIERSPDRQRSLTAQGINISPDLEMLPVGFHAATMFQVLEHLDDPMAVLRGIHRVMLPGAVLILEVPDCEGISGISSLSDYRNIHPLEHINCFTPASLTAFAERAGFVRTTVHTAHVTTDVRRTIKGAIGGVVKRLVGSGTNQFFLRV